MKLHIATIVLLFASVIVGLPVPEDSHERNKHLIEGGIIGTGIGAGLTYLVMRKPSGAATSEVKAAISSAIGRSEHPTVARQANNIASKGDLSKMTFDELENLSKVKLAQLAQLRTETNKMISLRQSIAKYQLLLLRSKEEGRSLGAIIRESNPNQPKLASEAERLYKPDHLDKSNLYIGELTREINVNQKQDLAIMSSIEDISAQMRKVTAQSHQK